jgi:hypothetical protein
MNFLEVMRPLQATSRRATVPKDSFMLAPSEGEVRLDGGL